MLYGLDYCNPGEVSAKIGAIPSQAHVLLTHQVWREFLGAERGDVWLNEIPRSVQLVCTGDFHAHRDLEEDAMPSVISPGPLCMQNIGERAPKGVYILFDDLT